MLITQQRQLLSLNNLAFGALFIFEPLDISQIGKSPSLKNIQNL